MMRPMTPDDLVTLREIETLKYRYVRLLDTKAWDELATLFTEDATASYGGGAYTYEGRDEILGFLRRNMDRPGQHTSHKVHHPEIELTGPDEASAMWGLDDVVVDVDFGITVRGAAIYSDRYRRDGGEWRIAHTGYRRLYEELQPRPDDLALTASWFATDGRSSLPVA